MLNILDIYSINNEVIMTEEKQNGIKFKRILGNKGGVLGVTFPPELIEYLGLEEGNIILFQPETGKFGNFISVWKENK